MASQTAGQPRQTFIATLAATGHAVASDRADISFRLLSPRYFRCFRHWPAFIFSIAFRLLRDIASFCRQPDDASQLSSLPLIDARIEAANAAIAAIDFAMSQPPPPSFEISHCIAPVVFSLRRQLMRHRLPLILPKICHYCRHAISRHFRQLPACATPPLMLPPMPLSRALKAAILNASSIRQPLMADIEAEPQPRQLPPADDGVIE